MCSLILWIEPVGLVPDVTGMCQDYFDNESGYKTRAVRKARESHLNPQHRSESSIEFGHPRSAVKLMLVK